MRWARADATIPPRLISICLDPDIKSTATPLVHVPQRRLPGMSQVPARFTHLSTNNHPPTPLEVAALRKELATRNEALDNLMREAERLMSESLAYEALLAPLRRLEIPPEILGTVFQLVMLTTAVDSMLQLQHICLVCQAWRDVALATPSLWVDLRVSTNNLKTQAIPVDDIKAWFSRSGSIPKRLSLSTTNQTVSNRNHCPLHTPEFVSLLAEGPLLQELSLVCDSLECLSTLITLVNDSQGMDNVPWDSLSKLTLDGSWGWGGVNGTQTPIQILPHLPMSLSTLCISLPYYDEVPSQLYNQLQPLSIPSLQALDLRCDWPVAWILKTLEACSNVRSLELALRDSGANWGDNDPNGNNLSKSTLPKLQNLRLRRLPSRNPNDTGILSLLVCPSIAELDISFENDTESAATLREDPTMEDSQLVDNLAQFVAQSKCAESLWHFRLHGLKISSAGLLAVLIVLPSITHLTLEDLDVDEYICRLMKAPVILPRLETLEFIHFPLAFEELEFGELVAARSPAAVHAMEERRIFEISGMAKPAALKKAVLSHYTKRPFPPARNWPQVLEEKGVDCSMDLIWGAQRQLRLRGGSLRLGVRPS